MVSRFNRRVKTWPHHAYWLLNRGRCAGDLRPNGAPNKESSGHPRGQLQFSVTPIDIGRAPGCGLEPSGSNIATITSFKGKAVDNRLACSLDYLGTNFIAWLVMHRYRKPVSSAEFAQ